MAIHTQGPFSNGPHKSRHLPWIIWVVTGIVIIAIVAFTITVIYILKSQGIAHGTAILTIISIIFGVVVGLLGLMLAFLQWHHARSSSTYEPPGITHASSQSPVNTGDPNASSHIPQSFSLTTQAALPAQMVSPEIPRIASNLIREPLDEQAKMTAALTPRVDWGEAPHIGQFYGREKELGELKQWIVDDHCRMVAILGMGGIGKTSLAVALVDQVKDIFTHVFWCSLQHAPPLKITLQDCIQFVSAQQRTTPIPEDADSQISVFTQYLRDYRCLFVMDNAESVLQGGNRAGQYRAGYEGYGELIQRIGELKHQSCLLLTSREKPKEVAHLEGITAPVRSLSLAGLRAWEGQELLKDKGLSGMDNTSVDLIRLYSGNPLYLKLVSEAIQEVFGGDIARFLQQGKAVFGDIRDPLDLQFTRLSTLERELLYWLAIEREAVSLDELRQDLVHPASEGDLLASIGSLRRRSMIAISGAASFTLQPVIMEYVTDEFVDQVCKEFETERLTLFRSYALINVNYGEKLGRIPV